MAEGAVRARDRYPLPRWQRAAGVIAALLFIICGLVQPAQAQAAGAKVALVIANARYQSYRPLANPASDARLMQQTFQSLGFTVTLVENADRATMVRALKDFGVRARGADMATVYYAGHGIEVKNVNYLIPVDAQLKDETDAELEAVPLETVLSYIKSARTLRLIILDACRENPFAATMQTASGSTRSLGMSRGLMPIEPGGQSLVLYAAKAGSLAADGDTGNSPFARALSARLAEPGVEIGMTLRRVRDDVMRQTHNRQEPFTYGSLSSDAIYLKQSVAPVSAAALASPVAPVSSSAVPPAAMTFSPPPAPTVTRMVGTAQRAGLSLRLTDDGAGLLVTGVSSRGPAYGQVFEGDVITAINFQKTRGDVDAAQQLDGALAAGRAQLLVRRGPSTATVVLRSN
ncbi:caspase family protein [Novosphingobium colocasiae]|uniref:Caspase family p20 domain-containing protein n=1 Tax=Novosphingobium colocasiae TaxID=1256513 RepID=A0A918PJX2_9SPHN|nr:caspase family protein [Novosphingobium colocasiae]GGZ11961.1 hypothetical protein GCM10011614_28710 [Novosphingobium colocasiae]